CSVGFVTGGTMANLTCLAAARGAVSRAHGWDVDALGIVGGPAITVVGSQHTHSTVPKALRLLGLGHDRLVTVAHDDQARIDPAALAKRLGRIKGPIIVTVQAGDVHTGGVDRFDAIADVLDEVRERHPPGGVWLHVDGAIGLWGAASSVLAPQFEGLDRADSWSTDAHKWLSTPYDSGVAIVAHPADHHRAMAVGADYLLVDEHADRDPMDWTPELSRRARAVSLYATLRSLGRAGVVELVERSHRMAQRGARHLAAIEGIEVCNDVTLNQVMIRCWDRQGDAIEHTPAVLAAVQASGITFPTHGDWDGLPVMRLSFSHWATDVDDVDRTVGAIARAHHALRN
ncbi:MAG TPA: pyridoxal-dependent decarboxylase, partial [Nitriliruptoraceae bacterium]|nr:pyridoxal-dependent decarboxylase [Nitriliruptoraceae bacterium]